MNTEIMNILMNTEIMNIGIVKILTNVENFLFNKAEKRKGTITKRIIEFCIYIYILYIFNIFAFAQATILYLFMNLSIQLYEEKI